jgi:hypothetical protein
VSRHGMGVIGPALARIRLQLAARARVSASPRVDRLMPLMERAENATRAGESRRLVKLLDAGWMEAARAGIPRCHVGTAGRPS